MRFALGFISAVLLTNMVFATSATETQVNMGINANEFKAEQVSQLEMKQEFEAFHWKSENEQKLVDRVFKFELNEPAELQITDFMLGGDVFEVMDNGKSIGKTSELKMAPNAEPLYAATPEEALEDARFSKAAYPLEAGAHEITIKVADSVNENGTGAVRVVRKMQSLWGKRHEKHDDDDDDKDDHDDKDDDKDDDDKDDDKKEHHVKTVYKKGEDHYETVYKKGEDHYETVYKKKFKTETDTYYVWFTATPTKTVTETTTKTTTETTTTSGAPIEGCFDFNSGLQPFIKGRTGSAFSYQDCIDRFGNCPTDTVAYGMQYRVIQQSSNYYTCYCYSEAELPTVQSGSCNLYEKNSDNLLYYYGENINNVFIFYPNAVPSPVTTPVANPLF